jgi:DNA-binding MarR family transcriptional regulator
MVRRAAERLAHAAARGQTLENDAVRSHDVRFIDSAVTTSQASAVLPLLEFSGADSSPFASGVTRTADTRRKVGPLSARARVVVLTYYPYKEYPHFDMTLAAEIRQRRPFESPEHEAYLNLVRTATALMRRETELLKAHDLTPAQFNVLRIRRGAGGDGLICREIGERMLTWDPDVTKLLDRLETRGLVTRERQPRDRRAIVARVTRKGLSMLQQVDKPMLDMVTGLLGHLGERRLKRLSELLAAARERGS